MIPDYAYARAVLASLAWPSGAIPTHLIEPKDFRITDKGWYYYGPYRTVYLGESFDDAKDVLKMAGGIPTQ